MEKDIEKVLISEIQIKDKVKDLAQRLVIDYEKKNLAIIGVLKR